MLTKNILSMYPLRIEFQIRDLTANLTNILRSLMVGLDRVELSTPRLSSACSNQLSYRPSRPRIRLAVLATEFGVLKLAALD